MENLINQKFTVGQSCDCSFVVKKGSSSACAMHLRSGLGQYYRAKM